MEPPGSRCAASNPPQHAQALSRGSRAAACRTCPHLCDCMQSGETTLCCSSSRSKCRAAPDESHAGQASPLVSATLFEILIGRQPAVRYHRALAVFASLYIAEPILTRVYIRAAVTAGERVSMRAVCSVRLACRHCTRAPCTHTHTHTHTWQQLRLALQALLESASSSP